MISVLITFVLNCNNSNDKVNIIKINLTTLGKTNSNFVQVSSQMSEIIMSGKNELTYKLKFFLGMIIMKSSFNILALYSFPKNSTFAFLNTHIFELIVLIFLRKLVE